MKSMKELVTTVGNKLSSAKAKAYVAASSAAMAVANPSVHAGISTQGEGQGAILKIAEIVVNIFPWVGIFFVVAGVFKLVLAYRNDQPEAQTSAAKDIVIGVVLIIFRVLAWPAISGLL